ncbi:restriction endonuclease subunit S [Anaerolineae bacterium CFX7]|nr:restriction endonuclease subunit S [Anaerolineae bacterium CFX7]
MTESLARFPSYPAYKPSNLSWLGDIPAHWEVKRLKNAVQINSETLPETMNPDFVLRYIDISNVDEISGINPPVEMRFADAPSRARRIVRAGDTIVSTVRTYLKAIAYFENPEPNLIVSTGFAVLRPSDEIIPEFLYQLVRSKVFIETVVAHSVGVGYPAINPSELSGLKIWLPSKGEQRAIAAFLDRETARLDTLIAKKEQLIERLQEKRTALISRAVTKGLDAHARMKDSGVEWLGEAPEHWEVKRLKFLSTEPLQYGANEVAEIIDPELPRFIRITDINTDGSLRDDTFRSLPQDVAKPFLLEYGDILFARSGATVGKSFMYQVAWGRACYAGYLVRARLDNALTIPEFVFYFVNSSAYWNWISSSIIQATIQNVSGEKYSNLFVPLPSRLEQKEVVEYLDRETEKIDALVAKIRDGIARLREYRGALIAAAVTGKIDVRDPA